MYDEYEEGYEDYPPQYRQRPRRRRSLHLKWLSAAVLALALVSLRFCTRRPQRPPEEVERTQVVAVTDWKTVDAVIRRGMEHAYAKAEHYALGEVGAWVGQLQVRVDEDFLPWWFSYLNQQGIMLKTAGWWCLSTPVAEGLLGKQDAVEARLERLVEREFHARVLQPRSAQLRMEKITRETIEIYLCSLQEELASAKVEYSVRNHDFPGYLDGVAATVAALEARRQVPLVVKGVSAGSGMAALRLGRVLVARVRQLIMRRMGREMLEGGMMMAGRYAARGAGWWVAGACVAWDLADHLRKTRQNLPVLRRSLATFLGELENQVLHDQGCGVLTTLDGVQRDVLAQLAGEGGGG